MQQLLGETDQTTYMLEDLPVGSWRFQVSAVNMAGEGPQSAIVQGPAVPAPPTNVALVVQNL
jgi:predicted phage tail protein